MTTEPTWQPRTDPFAPATAAASSGEGPPLTDELVRNAEAILGVRLPAAYVALMRTRNGGYLVPDLGCPTTVETTWAPDHVGVDSLNGIPAVVDFHPDDPYWAGDGILDTRYMTREWGLPEELVLLAGDGHTWIALDYRQCGPQGEPSVVWIDVDYAEDVQLAPDFAAFVDSLRRFE